MPRNADNLDISHTIDLNCFIDFEMFSKCQYSESRTIHLFHLTWGRQWTVTLVSSGSARREIQTDLEETKYFSEETKISDNSAFLKIKKSILRMFQGSINVQKTTDNITIRAMICFDFLKKKKALFQKNLIFGKSYCPTLLFDSIFKWHKSIQSKISQGVSLHPKTVSDETNWRNIPKKYVLQSPGIAT